MRTVRIATGLSLFFLFATTAVFAQSPRAIGLTNANLPGQHTLAPATMKEFKPGEKQCGPYFVLIPNYSGPGGIGVMFSFKGATAELGVSGLMSKMKFQTKIDDSKKEPTLEIVGGRGGTVDDSTVIVRISHDDYAKATDCLPKP